MAEVHYQLANVAGYRLDIAKIGKNEYDPLSYYYKKDFPDLKITRPNTETYLELLDKRALLTVNGYVYSTIYENNTLYVRNAVETMLKTRKNHVGILSFAELNKDLKKIPIKQSMIFTEQPYTLYQRAILKFNEPVVKPILIVAGYMIFETPNYFFRVADDTFVLNLEALNYMEKIYELNRYCNIFTQLGVSINTTNASLVDADVIRSNNVITKFLTLHNSFLVDVGTNYNIEKIYLEHSNVPCSFRTEVEPIYPIVVSYGKFTEYFKMRQIDSKFNIYTSDGHYNKHLFSYLPKDLIKVYNDHRTTNNTYRLTPAFFLKITFD